MNKLDTLLTAYAASPTAANREAIAALFQPAADMSAPADLPPQGFIDYIAANYYGTVEFLSPEWHAKRLWGAAMYQIKQAARAAAPVSSPTDAKGFTPMMQRGTLVYLGRSGGFDVRDCPEAESLAAFIVTACNAFSAAPVSGQGASIDFYNDEQFDTLSDNWAGAIIAKERGACGQSTVSKAFDAITSYLTARFAALGSRHRSEDSRAEFRIVKKNNDTEAWLHFDGGAVSLNNIANERGPITGRKMRAAIARFLASTAPPKADNAN